MKSTLLTALVFSVVVVLPLRSAEQRSPTAAEPREDTVLLGNTAKRLSPQEFSWTAFVMGSDETLKQIRCVEYVLHPTFQERKPSQCDRGGLPGKGFFLPRTGWGTFLLGATIVTTTGRSFYLTRQLHFSVDVAGASYLAPGFQGTIVVPVTAADANDGLFAFGLSVVRKAGQLEVRVDTVQAQNAATARSRWQFDLSVNGRPAIHVPLQSYSLGRSAKPVARPTQLASTRAAGAAMIAIEGRH